MKKTLLTYGLSAALFSILLLAACVGSNETEPAATAAPAAAVEPTPAARVFPTATPYPTPYLEYDEPNVEDYIVRASDNVFSEDALPGTFWGDSRQSPFSPKTGKVHPEPAFVGIASWINSEPLTLEELRGNVVLVDFWTYSCINCVWTLPYMKEWYDKYTDLGLVIIGVHSPEMRAEKRRDKVLAAVAEHGLKYPVAQDNDFETWRAFGTVAWPTLYLVDKDGVIRYSHFGSGGYFETEKMIQELLAELGT